ncbi:MAG TPA: tryptophan synthase subunit beta [Amaricoccus sp.]|nr:tryptophan synthase subunit beta [Amaricoccus sp.]
MKKDTRRLHRQFTALGRAAPVVRPLTERLLRDGTRLIRLPVALLLLLGGFFSFLPVLGLWMLPLGVMLLAVDVPLIRPTVSASFIRTRRRLSVFWRQRVRGRRPPIAARGVDQIR